MAKQPIKQAMNPNPTTVAPEQSVAEAARLMRSEDVGSLPVVDGDRLVGMVTDRDVALRVVAEGRDPDGTKVGDIHSREVLAVTPEQYLDDALAEMARHQVRRLAVVDGERLVGILAQADVARAAEPEQTGDVVEEISEPR
jgi:CBS domain-containing protein